MADSVAELQLTDYLDIVGRRKWVIVALVAILLAAAIAMSALQTPQYRASARVRVDLGSSNPLDDTTNVSSSVRSRNLQNEVEFANSDRVATRASTDFGEVIRASVAASANSDTLSFTAVDADPEQAAEVANTFANAYVTESSSASGERFLAAVSVINDRLAAISTERLALEQALLNTTDTSGVQIQIGSLDAEETRLRAQLNQIDVSSQLNNSASVSILNAADAPVSPFAPSWVRNIGLALVAGAILGAGVALLLETLDDTILDKRDLERATDGVPVIGVIPPPHKSRFAKRERRLVTSRTGAFTESRRLRLTLRWRLLGRGPTFSLSMPTCTTRPSMSCLALGTTTVSPNTFRASEMPRSSPSRHRARASCPSFLLVRAALLPLSYFVRCPPKSSSRSCHMPTIC